MGRGRGADGGEWGWEGVEVAGERDGMVKEGKSWGKAREGRGVEWMDLIRICVRCRSERVEWIGME